MQVRGRRARAKPEPTPCPEPFLSRDQRHVTGQGGQGGSGGSGVPGVPGVPGFTLKSGWDGTGRRQTDDDGRTDVKFEILI